jgi:hypothetical protein
MTIPKPLFDLVRQRAQFIKALICMLGQITQLAASYGICPIRRVIQRSNQLLSKPHPPPNAYLNALYPHLAHV